MIFDCHFFAAIKAFTCEGNWTQMFSGLTLEVESCFTVITNVGITEQRFVDKVVEILFLNWN